jgi:hypothetical protein
MVGPWQNPKDYTYFKVHIYSLFPLLLLVLFVWWTSYTSANYLPYRYHGDPSKMCIVIRFLKSWKSTSIILLLVGSPSSPQLKRKTALSSQLFTKWLILFKSCLLPHSHQSCTVQCDKLKAAFISLNTPRWGTTYISSHPSIYDATHLH